MAVVLYSSDGDVPKVGYFRNIPDEFKIKSLYSNDLILNIASKTKGAVQKLFRNPLCGYDKSFPYRKSR